MKFIKHLVLILGIVLFNACSSDEGYYDGQDELLGSQITITASVGDNAKSLGRAGIEEGNDDYNSGEKFYWTQDDKVVLYFVSESGAIKNAPFAATNVADNTADFVGNIPAGLVDGSYTVYAAKDLTQGAGANQLKAMFTEDQTQNGASSDGILLPMLSLPLENIQIKKGNVVDNTHLNFSLKQLNSILRFAIENNTDQAMTIESVSVYVENERGEIVKSFSHEGVISLNTLNPKWVNIAAPSLKKQTLMITPKGTESTIAVGEKLDTYISVLPTTGFDAGHKFVVDINMTGADGNSYRQTRPQVIKNTGDFAFLSIGFQQGKRYYFIPELKYASVLGDHGGDPFFNMDNIKFWVGQGDNESAIVIEWHDGIKPDAMVWGYRWDDDKDYYGIDMVLALAKADPKLIFLTHQTGPMGNTIAGFGYNLTGTANHYLIFDGDTSNPHYPVDGIVTTDAYDYDDWKYGAPNGNHYYSGWYTGYWSYWVKDSYTDSFSYSGWGASSRQLISGSWDGWSVADLSGMEGNDLGTIFTPAMPPLN